MEEPVKLSPVAHAVVGVFENKETENNEQKISVNRFISEVASWYEKLRNAMELRDEEIILKNAIDRILKRRLLLGGTGEKAAEPLLRELVWARYFADNTVPHSLITRTANIIDFYLELKHKILEHHKIPDQQLNELMFDLMSCDIARTLRPNKEKETMSNFMYHLLKDSITIQDDTEDTKNVQIYLAVRRAFAKDDRAFLRFHLFQQIFPESVHHNLDGIAMAFGKGYKEMQHQLTYRLKEKIFVYVKRQTPVFFILEDVLQKHKKNLKEFLQNQDEFANAVVAACDVRYKSIRSRVTNAIIRSVIFLLLTKVAIAFVVEGTYDNFVYGHIDYRAFIINIVAPPLLLIFVSFFIKTPNLDNSKRILKKIFAVLGQDKPQLAPPANLFVNPKKTRSVIGTVFAFLWILMFGLSFGLMIWGLTKIGFNPVSQAVFIFFITIVSFLAWRINATANAYTVDKGQGILTPFIDILFLPIIKVGMRLTDGISQINIFIFIFDFLIEAPFKTIFQFLEQLFGYVHAKREDLE